MAWINAITLVCFDLIFAGAFFVAMIPLLLAKQAAYAVMKRNFKSYFSNPTGYVFLAIFVLLTSMAAFWPHEFFNANLANLAQLNQNIGLIMLIFVPAITMGLWADERRQGTDELLLTLPATDFDIVMGKYLAAVAVFSVSLLFSQFCNFLVLNALSEGDMDIGLFLTTYIGYWFIGLAMISLGMVASFLTHNLTLGFVMGVLINAPFVMLQYADAFVTGTGWIQFFSQASIGSQFEDFGRGVVSLSSLVYFIMLTVFGVYLSMVLIGRRHWLGGKDGESRLGHYLLRTISLVVIASSATLFFVLHDSRWDATAGKTSSISPQTMKLIRNLKSDEPVRIEAFISAEVPESYAEVKSDLISYLNEFRGASGAKMDVFIYDDLEPFSELAEKARDQYGIMPVQVVGETRGIMQAKEIILGAAVQRGLEKVVIPFFGNRIPVEYELVRSISTVTDQQRKRIGVLTTDAMLFGGVRPDPTNPFGGFQNVPKQRIVDELEKQYDVEQVDPGEPIDPTKFDVLVAVQPSSLTQPQLDNLLTAVKAGVPTAIFDDPVPLTMNQAPPISAPKAPQGSAMFGRQQPPPQKCDIRQLWSLLGVTLSGQQLVTDQYFNANIIWQKYNPHPKLRIGGGGQITPEWVFVDRNTPIADDALPPLNPDIDVSQNLSEVLFVYPGAILRSKDFPQSMTFTPLIRTGNLTGTVTLDGLTRQGNGATGQHPLTGEQYTLAALIEGTPSSDVDKLADPNQKKTEATATTPIRVAMVADIDLLHSAFVGLQAEKNDQIELSLDNTTFVLNLLDNLAGDDRFTTIRGKSPRLARLTMVDTMTKHAVEESTREEEAAKTKFEAEQKAKEEEINKPVEALQDKIRELQAKQARQQMTAEDQIEVTKLAKRVREQEAVANRKLQVEAERITKELQETQQHIQRDLDRQVLKTQNTFKMFAVILPPIPPILVGLIVFVIRRIKEREGLSKDRIVK
ncbi:Gldg family protein [Blastopirellula sp. J2-11]|uniref:Gldg family protein n=1 Tax=Blastopirellula sp. J2-11 TaxID=2943192 RepID=UPI0021C84134|nr:Gldg family protein [Blastopirellula sp. J2-11]UUO08388.1 Gldg family protein [Blastopirellula sp. J2-11]